MNIQCLLRQEVQLLGEKFINDYHHFFFFHKVNKVNSFHLLTLTLNGLRQEAQLLSEKFINDHFFLKKKKKNSHANVSNQ
jgi:hypothetical protein